MGQMFKLLLLLVSLFNGTVVFADSILKLNKKGLSALYKSNYDHAIYYFEQVLQKSPRHPFANYNLACSYALKVDKDNCAILDYEEKIFTHLKTAIEENKSYRSKILKDSDLLSLKGKYQFYHLAGLPPRKILPKITWYGPSKGIFGPIDQFEFRSNGRFLYRMMEFDENGNINQKELPGRYYWKKENLHLIFNKPLHKKRKYSGKVKENLLEIEGFDHHFTDNNDPCSA